MLSSWKFIGTHRC